MKLTQFLHDGGLILCNKYKCQECTGYFYLSNPPKFCPDCGKKVTTVEKDQTPREPFPFAIQTLGDVLRGDGGR